MQRNIEEITSELIGLPRRERLELVRFLLFLDDHSSDSKDVESSWAKEITARVQAVENGSAEAMRLQRMILFFHLLAIFRIY